MLHQENSTPGRVGQMLEARGLRLDIRRPALGQIVHADDKRNELEDHLVWRIAELIGVSGRARIEKRQDVERRNKGEPS